MRSNLKNPSYCSLDQNNEDHRCEIFDCFESKENCNFETGAYTEEQYGEDYL